ncbi:leucine-rich_repeat domain-containing protein [Hexamita inflata]|uniref:Leucine-rich repeat domain-containing protein n=1 Tax=Hexamita inflata TaxID=28002 RepID=A0AA86U473_9EUKA|nr:leucine-rich repeat domain-containing protein [Hexamita inflata]
MEDLMKMNVPLEVWEDASNSNLLSFNQEFTQKTKQFRLNSRQIEYIYLISFLTNLTELSLQNNNISDISAITKLKNLKKLNVIDNRIEDILTLLSLPNLTHLDLQQNILTSYTLALPNLVDLKLGYNKLINKSGLYHSSKLQILYLSATETTDLRTIPHELFGLKDLELYRNNIMEISYLSNFVDLQSLSLGRNKQLQNIGPLKFCTQLTQLRIYYTSVADIWPLQYMKNLKILDMNCAKVIDLHPLQLLYKLEYISGHSTCIIDVSPLAGLIQLDIIYLNNNKITNADSLKHHMNYSEYRLSNQQVPTPDELTFYSKILSVHNSQKQIQKLILAENRASKFQESMTHQKEQIKIQINQHIRVMNKKIEIWAQFIQNSNTNQ